MTGRSKTSIEEILKFINNDCPVCRKTCACKACSQKRYQSKNLEIISINTTDNVKEGYNELDSCLECQLNMRQREAIKIECSKCTDRFCVACLKADGKV